MRAWLVRTLLRSLALLPLPLNHALGAMIGLLFYLIPNNVKRISRINLALCLPELDAQQRTTLLRQSLIETGKSATEMGAMWHWNARRLLGKIRAVKNRDILEQALTQQRGVILLTPHLGAWELNSLQYPHGSMTCLYRPPRMQALENTIIRARERTGVKLVPTSASGVKALYAALGRKETIGILPDQDPGKGGSVFAPFFGVPASTIKLVSRLTSKTAAPVVMIYAQRLSWGRGYVIRYQKPDDAIYSSDPLVSTTAMNQAVESCIRANTTQYQWGYKRFKTRPEGERSPYS